MSEPRSWLFVPADSEKKIGKAIESEADAVIFDLEDSVALRPEGSCTADPQELGKRSGGPQWWVESTPSDASTTRTLEVLGLADIHGIVLPKAEGGADVVQLAHRTGNIPVHAIVTETAASLFGLLSSARSAKSPLAGIELGCGKTSAAIGASSKYDADGRLSYTYMLGRSLCLAGAVAASSARRRRVRRLPRRRRPACRSGGCRPRRLHRQARHPTRSGRRDQCRLHPFRGGGRNTPGL